MRKLSACLLVLFLITISCTRDKNPLKSGLSGNGAGALFIQTDQASYTWKNGEDGFHLYLNGAVTNTNNLDIYSRISPNPDFGSWDEPFCVIAGNSWAQVEKYNNSTGSWEDTSIEGMLIEGSCFMTLENKATYPLNGPLSFHSNNREAGQYRIVIEYTFTKNPGNDAKTYRDYSNTFEIK